jgi:hypothetical protein
MPGPPIPHDSGKNQPDDTASECLGFFRLSGDVFPSSEDALSSSACALVNHAISCCHLPAVVFWNVQSRNRQQPVRKNEEGVILVSGCTPRLFSMVASGQLEPVAFMLNVLQK